MPGTKINGFEIVLLKGDPWQPHVHVCKDGNAIGKFDLVAKRWIYGPRSQWDTST